MAEVQYIRAGKKNLPAFFGMRALNELAKTLKKSFPEVTNPENYTAELDLDMIIPAAVVALNTGARWTGSKKRYNEDEVWDLIEMNPEDKVLEQISELLASAVTPTEDHSPNSSPASQEESTER